MIRFDSDVLGDDSLVSSLICSSFKRLALDSISKSGILPGSDEVESNFGRFKCGLMFVSDFSSTEFVFDNRGLGFDVAIACFGKMVCKSRRRIYLVSYVRHIYAYH